MRSNVCDMCVTDFFLIALVSAPAENVRLLVEGGTSHNSWSHAWKEVFRGSPPPPTASRHDTIEEIRKVRSWMKEVGDMTGRGWHGLGYTLGKDVTGALSGWPDNIVT